jgi:hypothetical protein
MEWNAFESHVRHLMQEHPVWFQLDRDPPASLDDIQRAEAELGTRLPESYRRFLQVFGGGYFAFAVVFSVSDSEWSVVRRNEDGSRGFVRASDNGTGDYYGFKSIDGVCSEQVFFFDHEDGSIRSTEYGDFLEMMVDRALKE